MAGVVVRAFWSLGTPDLRVLGTLELHTFRGGETRALGPRSSDAGGSTVALTLGVL